MTPTAVDRAVIVLYFVVSVAIALGCVVVYLGLRETHGMIALSRWLRGGQ